MANTWLSNQLSAIYSRQGTANAGLTGSPGLKPDGKSLRSPEYNGRIKIQRFNITQVAMNAMPGITGQTFATGDTVLIGELDTTDRIYLVRFYASGWAGTNPTLAIGKIDPNNSANTDANHYYTATDITSVTTADGNLNMCEQVGDDPAGDLSVGNALPNFGASKIQITAKFGGTLSTAGLLNGFILYTDGN